VGVFIRGEKSIKGLRSSLGVEKDRKYCLGGKLKTELILKGERVEGLYGRILVSPEVRIVKRGSAEKRKRRKNPLRTRKRNPAC